jgi:hypothetical protein
MRKPLTSWLLGTAVLLASVAARAEEPTKSYPECTRAPTDGEVAAAKGAHQAGSASFDEADYARAIDYWEDAYRRDCTADALLLNLARAYELSGRKRQAVVALETYIQREPSAGGKDQLNRRIDVLKKQIAQEAATAAPPPTTNPQTNAVPGPTAAPAAQTGNQPDPQPLPEEPQGKRSVVPLVVAGAGGLVLIVGAAIYFPARSDVNRYESNCTDPERRLGCPPGEIDAANAAASKQQLGGALVISGAVIAAGGVVWYFVSPRKPAPTAVQARRTELTPAVGPGYAGLNLAGSF